MSLIPTKLGATWINDEDDGRHREQVVITNVGETELAGHHVIIRRGKSTSFPARNRYWVQDQTGLYMIAQGPPDGSRIEVFAEPRYYVKAPIAVGTNWNEQPLKSQRFPGVVVPIQARIEGLHESVRTPMGTFDDCIEVVRTGTASDKSTGGTVELTDYTWIARNVGVVKSLTKSIEKVRPDEPEVPTRSVFFYISELSSFHE